LCGLSSILFQEQDNNAFTSFFSCLEPELRMMQELLLFGQVPAEDHRTMRRQLAGLARMQPQPVLERHLIFRPLPPPGLSNPSASSGVQGPQQQELQKTRQLLSAPLNYVQLVGVAESRGFDPQTEKQAASSGEGEDHGTVMTDNNDESKEGRMAFQWYFEFKDIPEPGKVSTTSRAISKTRILEGDPIQFLTDLGYE
jgi:mediator of RNA polymerase II transcription subunit 18, fungi type